MDQKAIRLFFHKMISHLKKITRVVLRIAAIIAILLIVIISVQHLLRRDLELSIIGWESNYINYRMGGWYIDENVVETDEMIDMIYSPSMWLDKGTYTIQIDYECENDQGYLVHGNSANDVYIDAGFDELRKDKKSISHDFVLAEDVADFEILIKYNGKGALHIKNISIKENRLGLLKEQVFMLFGFLQEQVFMLFGFLQEQVFMLFSLPKEQAFIPFSFLKEPLFMLLSLFILFNIFMLLSFLRVCLKSLSVDTVREKIRSYRMSGDFKHNLKKVFLLANEKFKFIILKLKKFLIVFLSPKKILLYISNWKCLPVKETITTFFRRNIFNRAILILYLYIVISIRLFILCNGRVTVPFVLSQLLVLIVLIAICPFLQQKISQLTIQIQDMTDRKHGIFWGILFFAVSFAILFCWYTAYYPGVFSAESIGQYRQALSGEYNNTAPVLQTWIAFTLPIKMTGRADFIILFQIVEYSAVIAYMLYVLLKYGGKCIAILAFLYIMLNPVTGNVAIYPGNNTTFTMFAILLMTLGLQIHITDGKWLDQKTALPLLTIVLTVTTFVNPRGLLFTAPFLAALLFRFDRKRRLRFLILLILGLDIIMSRIYLVAPEAAKIWNYEAEQIKFPSNIDELKLTDMVYAIDGDVDWEFYPEIAENDLGLEFRENRQRAVLQNYTEYTRHSTLKYLFWCVGIINLITIIAVLCKCRFRKREDWNKILFTLPLLCYNFGSMFLMTWNDFRFFCMSFPICPIILMILFGKRTQESVEEVGETTVYLTGEDHNQNKKTKFQYVTAVIYTLILFALNYMMVLNINFWSDEGYSIKLSKMSFFEMIDATAMDVHPPLYYVLLQIISRAMGFRWVSYRLLSIIPYGILLIFALTVIWKKFGKEASLTWITLLSLLYTGIQYNVQVRMYSWGAFFVLMSFYFLHEILSHNRIRDYSAFVMMSLAAAYTHYYCLISVAFFYLTLILVALTKRKEFLKKVLMACDVTILAYLPWFFILLKTFNRTSEGYWMAEIPSLKECLLFLFSSKWQTVFLLLFFIITVIYVMYETEALISGALWKARIPFLISVSDLHVSKNAIWMTAGLVSVIGTALTGIIVSQIFRPMFTLRYIYPVSVVACLMLGIGLEKYKKKMVCMAIIVVLVMDGGIPHYLTEYNILKYEEERLCKVLDATEREISVDDVILTDIALLHWGNIGTYYPGIKTELIDVNDLGILNKNIDYWLFIGTEKAESKIQMIEGQGYEAIRYVSDGNLGRIPVCVYRLDKK